MTEDAKSPFDPAGIFTKMWTDLAGRMSQAGWTMPPGTSSSDSAKKFRDVFLQAMTEYGEQYMRSPEFLQSMKEGFRQSIEFRKQMNDYLGHVQHEFQGPNRQDIDHVMASISRLESRLSTTLQRMETRLDEMSSRLDTQAERAQAPKAQPAQPPKAQNEPPKAAHRAATTSEKARTEAHKKNGRK